MVFQVIVFIIASWIFAKTRAEITDYCQSKAETSVSLDFAIHLLQQAKDYHNQGRSNKTPSKKVYSHPIDCEEVLLNGMNKSGIYTIWPQSKIARNPIKVYCDMDTNGGGWTVFQRRGDFGRPKDFFYQNWKNYKLGFGDLDKDFWLGNYNIFTLSNQRDYSLRVDLRDVEGKKAYAVYDTFWIDHEDREYTLHVVGYSGDAGDSMIEGHNGQKFSTKDRKNDILPSKQNCAELFKGGWWYKACHVSNLNGVYQKGKHEALGDGVNWVSFRGSQESLEWTEMKIRSREFTL